MPLIRQLSNYIDATNWYLRPWNRNLGFLTPWLELAPLAPLAP